MKSVQLQLLQLRHALGIRNRNCKGIYSFKIELVDADSHAPNHDPTLPPQVEEFKTIEEALSGRVSELEHLGWHIVISSDSISLFNVQEWKVKKDSRHYVKL